MKKLMLMAALMITLPAVVALVYGLVKGNQFWVYAALVSTALNWLPFLAAAWLMKDGGDGHELDH
jgi:hypothetical protein